MRPKERQESGKQDLFRARLDQKLANPITLPATLAASIRASLLGSVPPNAPNHAVVSDVASENQQSGLFRLGVQPNQLSEAIFLLVGATPSYFLDCV